MLAKKLEFDSKNSYLVQVKKFRFDACPIAWNLLQKTPKTSISCLSRTLSSILIENFEINACRKIRTWLRKFLFNGCRKAKVWLKKFHKFRFHASRKTRSWLLKFQKFLFVTFIKAWIRRLSRRLSLMLVKKIKLDCKNCYLMPVEMLKFDY